MPVAEPMVDLTLPTFEMELVRLSDGHFYMNVEATPATEGQWEWLRELDRKIRLRQKACAFRGLSMNKRPFAAVDPASRVHCPKCLGVGVESFESCGLCPLCNGHGVLEQQACRTYLAQWFPQEAR